MLFPFFSLSRSIYLYMLFQRCANNFTILHEPELLLRIPPSACCFRLESHRHVGGVDAQRNKSVLPRMRLRRCPFDLSTINSTVLSRCRNSASYRKRTQSRASPYFSARLFVPRCPGLRISRVFIAPPLIIMRMKWFVIVDCSAPSNLKLFALPSRTPGQEL